MKTIEYIKLEKQQETKVYWIDEILLYFFKFISLVMTGFFFAEGEYLKSLGFLGIFLLIIFILPKVKKDENKFLLFKFNK